MFRHSTTYQPAGKQGKTQPNTATILLAAVLLWFVGLPAGAQINPQGAIEIEQGGQIWIEGSASIVDYTCRAERLSGNGNIENVSEPQKNIKGEGAVFIRVSVPVKSLECGKRKMNNDMYKALKADQHHFIQYQLISASLIDSIKYSAGEEDVWMNIKTTGVVEIAGVEDTMEVMVQGQLISEDRFRVKGSKQISMSAYDITPPTAMFGLIKASEELTVHFDVTVRLKDASTMLGASATSSSEEISEYTSIIKLSSHVYDQKDFSTY